jgi:phosphoribosyl-ATP pyrophosphohydrolase/phosphoribosyl-AMP cyclohydrolase
VKIEIGDLKFDERGLIPAIVQDAHTREVLTLAYMNEESLRRTLETKETWFWSRSRSELWHKGETSGNTQRVLGVRVDCDYDSLVIMVEPQGAACHTGARSCFHHQVEGSEDEESVTVETLDLGRVLAELYTLVQSRERERPEGSYTTYLLNEGLDKILKKIGEEAGETIIAAKNQDAEAICNEASDLLYHLIVLLVERRIPLERVRDELSSRRKKG